MSQTEFFSTKIEDKTQAMGNWDVDVSDSYSSVTRYGFRLNTETNFSFVNWQIHFSPSGTPSAGTAKIYVKTPGASNFSEVEGTVDLVNGPLAISFIALAEEIRITPSSFDGNKTCDVVLAAF